MLVRAAWRGIEVRNIPVRVFYPEKAERVSHFRPGKDFTRISILNTFLVLGALLFYYPWRFLRSLTKENIRRFVADNITRSRDSNPQLAASIGLGIFFGIAPLWGYQMIAAAVTAHFTHLNKEACNILCNSPEMMERHIAIVQKCEQCTDQTRNRYLNVAHQHAHYRDHDISDHKCDHNSSAFAFSDIQGAFAFLRMREAFDRKTIERSGKYEAICKNRPAVQRHFAPKTDDQEEIADTDNNCEVSAVGIPQDFQLDFPRLMGTERIYCPEETIQKRAAR